MVMSGSAGWWLHDFGSPTPDNVAAIERPHFEAPAADASAANFADQEERLAENITDLEAIQKRDLVDGLPPIAGMAAGTAAGSSKVRATHAVAADADAKVQRLKLVRLLSMNFKLIQLLVHQRQLIMKVIAV